MPLLLKYDATIDDAQSGEGISLEQRRSKPQLAQNFHAVQSVRLLVRLAGKVSFWLFLLLLLLVVMMMFPLQVAKEAHKELRLRAWRRKLSTQC